MHYSENITLRAKQTSISPLLELQFPSSSQRLTLPVQATNVRPLQASCFSSLSFWCFFWGMAAQSHWILWWRRKQVLTRGKRNPELWRGAGGIKTYGYSCLFMTLRSREHMRSCCSLSCLLIGISLVPPYKRANLFYNPHPLQSL